MNKIDSKDVLVVFEDKNIRRIWHNDEWYFSVVDIIAALTDSNNPRNYWNMLKTREKEQCVELYTFCVRLKMMSTDGKKYETDCANTKSLFRIIQSIPSKKAEPFKLWLAKVGYERVQEIQNPEITQERMIKLYEQKGYSKSWIDKRIRGIAVRQDLTDEWTKRGIEKQKDFAILTAEISNAAFGMTPNEYKEFKNLNGENLRDHMTDLELIFSMLGEASTTEIERTKNPEIFKQHLQASKDGGTVAKNARVELETKTGKNVINEENYLELPEKEKRKQLK